MVENDHTGMGLSESLGNDDLARLLIKFPSIVSC